MNWHLVRFYRHFYFDFRALKVFFVFRVAFRPIPRYQRHIEDMEEEQQQHVRVVEEVEEEQQHARVVEEVEEEQQQ